LIAALCLFEDLIRASIKTVGGAAHFVVMATIALQQALSLTIFCGKSKLVPGIIYFVVGKNGFAFGLSDYRKYLKY